MKFSMMVSFSEVLVIVEALKLASFFSTLTEKRKTHGLKLLEGIAT